jgi:hypothetical protein
MKKVIWQFEKEEDRNKCPDTDLSHLGDAIAAGVSRRRTPKSVIKNMESYYCREILVDDMLLFP